MIKLCKDCKYFQAAKHDMRDPDGLFAKCLHPDVNTPNLVTGAPSAPYCADARQGHCGREANLFEACTE